MSNFLSQVQTGKTLKPRRVFLYGTHGIGKSTWASQSPDPIFIQTEDGLNDVGAPRFPMAGHFNDVIEQMTELYEGKHNYKTVAIDSVDWLERLIWESVCQDEQKDNIEEIGYAKGYSYAMKYWERIRRGLELIRNKKNMNIILIAHSKIEKFSNPENEPYDRYSPKLHKHASSFWQEWADEVFFANFKAHIVNKVEGVKGKEFQKARAVGEGRRVIYANERPSYLAKNRLGIDTDLSMEWSAYSAFIKPSKKGEK